MYWIRLYCSMMSHTTTVFLSSLFFFWCPCMAINVRVQYNGGLLPDIILLTQWYHHIHLPSAVRALIFPARRIQPFLSLVDREVEFCVLANDLIVSTRWAFLFIYYSGIIIIYFILFLVRKIPFITGIIELTSRHVRRLQGYL